MKPKSASSGSNSLRCGNQCLIMCPTQCSYYYYDIRSAVVDTSQSRFLNLTNTNILLSSEHIQNASQHGCQHFVDS